MNTVKDTLCMHLHYKKITDISKEEDKPKKIFFVIQIWYIECIYKDKMYQCIK